MPSASLKHATKKVLGLTGGIGSGKTMASDWFASQGITVVDADVVAREVVQPGKPALTAIVTAFGQQVLNSDGTLNRTLLREIVFSDTNKRHILEQITHPHIIARIVQLLTEAQSDYVILVSPLLLEGALKHKVDRILLIDVPEQLQIKRASQRDGQSEAQIKTIIQAQLSRKARIALANDVVVNDQHLEHLYSQLQVLHTQYLQWARQTV